jgi:hypothetical protein
MGNRNKNMRPKMKCFPEVAIMVDRKTERKLVD